MNLSRALSRTFATPPLGAGVRCLLNLGLYVVLGAATLSPLLWAAVPPLVDYPNHLAFGPGLLLWYFPYLFTEATPLDVTPRNRAVSGWGMPVTPEDLAKSADARVAKSFDDLRDLYGQRMYWRDWPQTFDYALWIDFGGQPTPPLPLKQLKPAASGSYFEIYQIIKQ